MSLLTGDAELYAKVYVDIGWVSIVGALALSYTKIYLLFAEFLSET